MPTLVHLIRHGAYPLLDQALGGRADHALSGLGRTQADRLAAYLADRPVAAVVSSPVRRAWQTAEPIGAALGLALVADPAFTEIDFAGWTGRRFADLAADPAWQVWNRWRGSAVVPGGESMLAVQGRAVAGLLRWAAAHPGAELAVVSHADVIKAVLAHVLGAPLDLMRRLEIGPGSLSQMELAEADARVLAVNLPP